MATRLQFLLEGVRDHVFHVLEFTLEVLQLAIVVLDYLLVAHVLVLQLLSFQLCLLKLLTQSLGQLLQLLSVLDVLLQLVRQLLALLLLQLFRPAQLLLLLPQLLQIALLSLVASSFVLVLLLDLFVLRSEQLLLLLSVDLVFVGLIQFGLQLGRFLPEGLDLVADVLQLGPALVEPNSKFVEYFLRHFNC